MLSLKARQKVKGVPRLPLLGLHYRSFTEWNTAASFIPEKGPTDRREERREEEGREGKEKGQRKLKML